MNKLDNKTLLSRITTMNKVSDATYRAEIILNVIYSGVHGNVRPLNEVVKVLKPFERKLIGEFVGVKPMKDEKGVKVLKFEKDKTDNLLSDKGLDFAPSFDDLENVFTYSEGDKEKREVKVDAVKAYKSLITRLENSLESGSATNADTTLLILNHLKQLDF